MGITGLLPYLKKIHTPVNISQFEGCTVAVDAYCWLHKGAFSCAEKLALGEKTDQFVYYCMKYVNCLLSKNIKPILVFDGCHLPSKKEVESTRRERREVYRKKAAAFLREGRRAEAKECLQRCVDITPQMALQLMNVCRDHGVDCIVAPYEADAQLAYLNKVGIAQVIITEDSDLLPFGCDKVVFKMDMFGNGVLVEQSRLNEVLDIRSDCYTFEKFRLMCILSGCDYLSSLSGIGLAKSNKVFKMARQPDMKVLLKKLPSYLKTKMEVSQEYIESFIQADNTFLYQLVFDPLIRRPVPLHPYTPEIDPQTLNYAGPPISDERAYQIALGNIDVTTGRVIARFDPATFKPKRHPKKVSGSHLLSIWDRRYTVMQKGNSKADLGHEETSSLLGHEKVISAPVLRRSPRKRKREGSESHDIKSDTELVSIYDDKVPASKRLQDDSETGFDNREVKHSPCKSPRKQTPGRTMTAASILDTTAVSPTKSASQKAVTPTKRNRFAMLSPSHGEKFDLNQPKITVTVRSRYFCNSSSPSLGQRKPLSPENNIDNHSIKSPEKTSPKKSASSTQEEVENRENNTSNTTPKSQKVIKSPGANKNLSAKSSKLLSKQKNGSVFSWARFSLTKYQSNFKPTETSSQRESDVVTVKKEESMDLRLYESETSVLEESREEFKCEIVEKTQLDTSVTDVIDLSQDSQDSVQSSTGSQLSSSSQSGQRVCRVSGLSRSKSKSKLTDKHKQTSIKDMLSKFALVKHKS